MTTKPRRPDPGERPKMEIGNVWRDARNPNRIHYMIYWTDQDGSERDAHLVELDGTAFAKILETRIR